jgi:hypothetical protein
VEVKRNPVAAGDGAGPADVHRSPADDIRASSTNISDVQRPDFDGFAAAITAGAQRALRNRAGVLRKAAANGITSVESHGRAVVIVSSEARAVLNVADDWDAIADELEREATS